MAYLSVALGGGLGSLFRYLLSLVPVRGPFPVMTFVTNLGGAFLIGLVTALAARHNWPDNVTLLFKTGFCGGFTTFSTFSLESFRLIATQHYIMAAAYMVLSVLVCLAGVILGTMFADRLSPV